jgi:hypothetical protein
LPAGDDLGAEWGQLNGPLTAERLPTQARAMSTDAMLGSYAIAVLATFLVNLPFGWWRARLRKFSPAWFVAIHAPVPIVIALRFALGLPFRWIALPVFVVAYFGGQFVGSRLRLRRRRA